MDMIFAMFEPQNMVAILSAVAVFASIVTLALPLLERNELARFYHHKTLNR